MDAPQDYKTAGMMMMISGGFTVLLSLAFIVTWTVTWLASILLFFVAFAACFWILTLVVGVFEIVVGVAMMQGKPKSNAKTISILGIVAAVCCGNIVPGIIVEVLAFSLLSKPEVASWIALESE